MQYNYITCVLPSNGKIYDTKEVHLRAKTIFDIKSLLNNTNLQLKSEIDVLNTCLDPKDNVNVYNLVQQDVIFLLYQLRSMSDDVYTFSFNNETYSINISDLDVKMLDEFNNEIELPDSKIKVYLNCLPIKFIYDITKLQQEFNKKYPDYNGDVSNAIRILESIQMFDNITTKDIIRTRLETLSFRDSLYLINAIEAMENLDFGIREVAKIKNSKGEDLEIPIQLNNAFFRPQL